MVYLDGVFVLNAALDALLLSATGKLTGRTVKPGRLALAAAIGGGTPARLSCLAWTG